MTLTGNGTVAVVGGKIGNAVNTQNGYLSRANLGLSSTGDWHFSAWINPTAGAGTGVILSQFDTSDHVQFQLVWVSDGTVAWAIEGNDAYTQETAITSVATAPTGQWTFVTCSYLGSIGLTTLRVGTTNYCASLNFPMQSGASPFLVGCNAQFGSPPQNSFNGAIDSLYVWKTGLSYAQEGLMYNSGSGLQP